MEAGTFYTTAAKRPRRVLSKATTVKSVAGSHAGSVQGLLEAEIRALKSRVAAVEATRVPDGIPDSFTERLVRVEEAVMDIKECLQRAERPLVTSSRRVTLIAAWVEMFLPSSENMFMMVSKASGGIHRLITDLVEPLRSLPRPDCGVKLPQVPQSVSKTRSYEIMIS
ncbi:hypothetical protein D9C73_000909 [Collichthys lucidus]|uniref:Uncharacterized protein n=1 Tax=Collichthys lucidus TaxID=240159 RepID=A0A4U5U145_COLLU|nr:hypothetical protein D9C73_000909 [Collichthys lucidus]